MKTNRKIYLIWIVLGLTLAAFSATHTTAYGQEDLQGDPERGGRLYSSWDLVVGFKDFDDLHPLWVSKGNSQPLERITWRCVNCHGWDYQGSAGRTLSNPQKAQNYPGVLAMMGLPVEDVLPWLDGSRNPDHDFSAYLSEQDMLDLSEFLSTALISPDLIASPNNNIVQGTVGVGRTVFQENCQSCHGVEGGKINFGSAANPSFFGDMAWNNPWRIEHVVRFGHIIGSLPAASKLDIPLSQQIDLLAYLQTLPRARMIASAESQNIDFSSQASTLPLVIGVVAIGGLVFAAVYVSVKRRS